MGNEALCFFSAAELADLIRGRQVSPVEIVEAMLSRIERFNGTLRAFLHVCADRARAEAKAAEIEILGGSYRGPLHGVPIAYKDIYDVAGLPTTANSRVMAGNVAREDASAVSRLRRAGAICLGKLNTYEFASGSMEVSGDSRNPWDTRRVTGGSSSGSGAALSGRLVPLAPGTDTGGSVRIPAFYCGVVGLRPTFGRISRAGIVPLSWSLDHPGPMARTVSDVALLLQAMAGPDPRDPSTAPRQVTDYRASLRTDLKGVRIGVPTSFFFEEADPEVVGAVRRAIGVLEGLGASLQEVDLPHAGCGPAAVWAIEYSEAFALHRSNFFKRPDDFTPAFLHKISSAACLTSEERITAQRVRQIITAEFVEALSRVDVIVTPTLPYPAHPIGAPPPQGSLRSLTRPVSLTGLPAVSVPCGFTSDGLPVGMQMIGRAWGEGPLLSAAHAYEQAASWHEKTPPLSEGVLRSVAPAPEQAAGTSGAVDARWVLDFARLHQLDFIRPPDAGPVADYLRPVKAQLDAARPELDARTEPPARPAPG